MSDWKAEQVEIIAAQVDIKELGERDAAPSLKKVCGILNVLGADYWIASGTLLGLHRENRFLPYDTDVDIEVVFPKAHKIVGAFTSAKLELFRALNYPICGAPMQRAFLDRDNKDIIIDLYFYYEDGDTLVNYNDHGKLVLPKKLVYPIKDEKPADIEGYLEWRYGSDWKTPTGEKREWGEDTKCLQ